MAQAQAVFFFASAVMAAGEVYDSVQTARLEEERQRVLNAEKRNAELAALDEENERLRDLTEANTDVIAMSGNIDPFSSPSLIAIRQANVKTAKKDLANIQQNRAIERAKFAMEIAMSKRRRRAAIVKGILSAGSTLLSGYAGAQKLGTPAVGAASGTAGSSAGSTLKKSVASGL